MKERWQFQHSYYAARLVTFRMSECHYGNTLPDALLNRPFLTIRVVSGVERENKTFKLTAPLPYLLGYNLSTLPKQRGSSYVSRPGKWEGIKTKVVIRVPTPRIGGIKPWPRKQS